MTRARRGMAFSVELAILIIIIIIGAFAITHYMSQKVLAQAGSKKTMASINEAHVWVYKQNGACQYISVTVYITNTGNDKITVRSIAVATKATQNSDGTLVVSGTLAEVVNPGETRAVSAYRQLNDCNVFYDDKTFVMVSYTDTEGRAQTVGKPVAIEWVGS